MLEPALMPMGSGDPLQGRRAFANQKLCCFFVSAVASFFELCKAFVSQVAVGKHRGETTAGSRDFFDLSLTVWALRQGLSRDRLHQIKTTTAVITAVADCFIAINWHHINLN